jgi:hypothetical protein
MRYIVRIHFPASNNVAKYEALINGLRIAVELAIRWLDVWGDSHLIIDQVMKESSYCSAKMAAYCQDVCQLEVKFDGLELNLVPRWLNEATDTLVKMVSGREPIPIGIFASNQYKPLVHYKEMEQTGDGPLPRAQGLTDHQLLPTSRSWSLMKIQWQSPIL